MSDRKKAIETLKENLCAMCAYGPQNMESCDIRSCDNRDAIKALEQEPTTKNNLGIDCISREKAIKWAKFYTKIYDVEVANKEIMKMLRDMPSLTPQEPVLDKIRAEIEAIIGERNLDDYDFCSGLICARKIIDKYKGESEDKE